jgi:hypothetical protein
MGSKGERYYVISSGCSGVDIDELTWPELLARLTPDDHGETYYGELEGFHKKLPQIDGGYFSSLASDKLLVIRGEIVTPQPKKVVQSYEEPDH